MTSLKNIRVLLVLTLAMQNGALFGMMAWLRPGCRSLTKKLIDSELALAVLRERALVADRIRQQLPAAELLKRDGEVWLINRELAKPRSASFVLARLKKSKLNTSELKSRFGSISSYGELKTLIGGWGKELGTVVVGNVIVTEVRHPGCRSFFHGADGQIRILLDLQKALAKKHGITGIEHFEFLRARSGREHLAGMTAQKYVETWRLHTLQNGEHYDSCDPWRTELISVERTFEHSGYLCTSNKSVINLFMHKWAEEVLLAYGLPMPYDLGSFDKLCPRVSHGLFMHILLCNACADRLVYCAQPRGCPCESWHLSAGNDEELNAEMEEFYTQYRIILDPSVFDIPNDNVQMYIHQKLSAEERKQIDQFISQLIHDAKKLKKQKELHHLDTLTTAHAFGEH